MKKTVCKVNVECSDMLKKVETEKSLTAKAIFEAAFDSSCAEYHSYTLDYISDYALNAFDVVLAPEEAQAILDVAESIKQLKESGRLNADEYSYLTQTLEFFV